MYRNGHNDLDSHTTRYFTEFVSKSGYDPKSFGGVSVEDLPLLSRKLFKGTSLYTISISKKENMWEN